MEFRRQQIIQKGGISRQSTGLLRLQTQAAAGFLHRKTDDDDDDDDCFWLAAAGCNSDNGNNLHFLSELRKSRSAASRPPDWLATWLTGWRSNAVRRLCSQPTDEELACAGPREHAPNSYEPSQLEVQPAWNRTVLQRKISGQSGAEEALDRGAQTRLKRAFQIIV